MPASLPRPLMRWLVAGLIVASTLSAVEAKEPTCAIRYGREARDETPYLERDPTKPLSERERIHHALSRLTFGPTSELITQVQATGLEHWLEIQFGDRASDSPVLRDHLANLKSLVMSSQEVVQEYSRRLPKMDLSPAASRERAKLRRARNVPKTELRDAVLLGAVYANNQLKEVMYDFWRNHFNVDVSKGNVRYYATEYEREVIRGEALGSFERLLNKTSRHPAMLVYLDNYVSRAAPKQELAKAAREAFYRSGSYAAAVEAVETARTQGLNENYARELLELHTLGVDNYYTQADVIAVAHALTGWTVQQNRNRPIVFQFRPEMHASEPRMILGQPIPPNPGNPESEGQAVLDLLVSHRGTAEFVAYKLCRHLVDDHPPRPLVKRVAARFLKKNTDLRAVCLAIVNDKEFFNPKHYQAKFKRPLEFVVSALRATGAEISSTSGIHRALVSMGEPIYQCSEPTGYYDQADAWRDPGAMAIRWQFALDLGMGRIPGVRIPPSFWEDLETDDPRQWKDVLTARILPGGCSSKTSEALDQVIARGASPDARPEQLGGHLVGVLLGSPEFQRQ